MYPSHTNAASTSITSLRLRPVFTHISSTVGVRRRPTEKLAIKRKTFCSMSESTGLHPPQSAQVIYDTSHLSILNESCNICTVFDQIVHLEMLGG